MHIKVKAIINQLPDSLVFLLRSAGIGSSSSKTTQRNNQ